MTRTEPERHALHVIREQIAEAVAAKKCHGCGCLHGAVAALAASELGDELAVSIHAAREVFSSKKYECLGCSVCFPALAANALSKAFAESKLGLDLCPTDAPAERSGWPSLPGDYHVVRYRASVAVCTLNSGSLAERLVQRAPDGLAIAGTMQTENLGIERLIRNVLANRHIRFLVLCGEDTRQAVGHLPGQSLESLFASGIDETGRIRGAKGKRPVIKNVGREQVTGFVRQVELVSMIGVTDDEQLARTVQACASRHVAPFVEQARHVKDAAVATIEARESGRLLLDPAGFFVVYPDRRVHKLVVEHYDNAGVLDCVIESRTAAAMYSEAIARSLIGRLDHAAYLGRELARAERSLQTGEPMRDRLVRLPASR